MIECIDAIDPEAAAAEGAEVVIFDAGAIGLAEHHVAGFAGKRRLSSGPAVKTLHAATGSFELQRYFAAVGQG